ncbi:alpha/beta fold hydrolase [Sneathiella chinensis]|uniref:Alpha/beta hydrolase n=1 Tax=Sneathiella chinensis TaxID=349750 RepID=A0ABQ5U5G7_9PROT|nr:alpha/beta hydrolase [Sneathiella chinensis]GLQ06483.1 alpha/beta hydrolase [Sneathiella chinensis]
MDKKTLTIAGTPVDYLEAGDGPALLCLHGFPDHPYSFQHQIRFFSNQGYRVIAPFMRGYGPDIRDQNPRFTASETSLDVINLLDALNIEKTLLIGHDWGATAAYAATLRAPERIHKLVTLAVPYGRRFAEALITDPDQQRRSWYMFFFLSPFAEAAVRHDDFAFLDRLWADWSPGWIRDEDYMAHLKETFRRPGVLKSALDYYRHTFGPAPEKARPGQKKSGFGTQPIPVPGLYFQGMKDGCMGVDLADGMEQLYPEGLKKVLLPEAGHFLHLEEPDLFNQTVLEFITEKAR